MIRVSAVKMLEFNQLKVKRRAVDILTAALKEVEREEPEATAKKIKQLCFRQDKYYCDQCIKS